MYCEGAPISWNCWELYRRTHEGRSRELGADSARRLVCDEEFKLGVDMWGGRAWPGAGDSVWAVGGGRAYIKRQGGENSGVRMGGTGAGYESAALKSGGGWAVGGGWGV